MSLTRSTIDDKPPNPREEALNDLLHWIWSWRLQLARLIDSTNRQGQGDTPTDKRRSFSRASCDEHLVLVVGRNVVRAISRAEKVFPGTDFELHEDEALSLLRNLYEHWDEQRSSFQNATIPRIRSGKEFINSFPSGKPWSITYVENDWLIGGVVPLNKVSQQLDDIEKKVLKLEEIMKNKNQS